MITTATFKKQIGKRLGTEMRKFGFKGTGFEYIKETKQFFYSVFLEGSRWGGQCRLAIGIHPKAIDKDSSGRINFEKIKYYDFEFKVDVYYNRQWWEYSDFEEENLQILNEIIQVIKDQVIPALDLFEMTPNVLESFEASDLQDFHKIFSEKTGLAVATTDIRFAWAMTIYYEKNNNLEKAKEFADYGYSQLTIDDLFFGKPDFERVIQQNDVTLQ